MCVVGWELMENVSKENGKRKTQQNGIESEDNLNDKRKVKKLMQIEEMW